MDNVSLLRGGNWNNGVKAGLFNLNLNNVTSNVNNNIGLRSAFEKSRKLYFHGIIISALSKGISALADKIVPIIGTTAKQIEMSISGVVVPLRGEANLPMEIV